MRRTVGSQNWKIIALLVLVSVASTHATPPVRGQTERLVVLMPTPSKYIDPYIEMFQEWYEAKTGKTIEVQHFRLGGVKCLSHVESQGGNPQEDVVASLGYDEFERLKTGGFLEAYMAQNREQIPEKIGPLIGKDQAGYYTGFSLAAYGIMLNTQVMEDENLAKPTGYMDLALNEDYYGRIAMGSPISTSIAHGNAEVILGHYGWVQGWNVSIQLASLIDRFFISTDTATASTAYGEYAAVLTKNTYWNEYVQAGYPVEWIWPDDGTGVYILYAGILKGAENRENAELWIDWMLSGEGQRAWVEFRHETVLRSDIELPGGIPTLDELDIAEKIDPAYNSTVVQQQYDAVSTIWSEKLIGSHSVIQKNYLNKDTLYGYLDSWIIKPTQQADDAITQAQNTIDLVEAVELTETGQVLLQQAKTKLSEAETASRIYLDHEKAVELASESYSQAQIAAGYIPPPPVWPYYLAMIIAVVLAGSVSGKLGYDYFKRRYKESIDEVFQNLKDKLEVDEAGRLLLVSDVMRVPMILTTRDHITQIQKTCERILGKERMVEVMYQSGFESGYDFATAIASMSELKGVQILEEYMRLASVRGWGRFKKILTDVEAGVFTIQIQSSIVEEFPPGEGRVCHIWRGLFAGVVQAVLESLEKTGDLRSEETMCLADGDSHCEIRITVTSTGPESNVT